MDWETLLYVSVMAVVQGIAEFLPISSSGHLLVLGRLFDLPDVFTLSILLHAGTLLSVIVFFAKDLYEAVFHRPRTLALVIVGTIPTVLIGFAILHYAKLLEESLLATGCFFIVTGVMLLTVMRNYGQRSEHELYFEEVARNVDDEDGDEYEEFKKDEPKTAATMSFLDAILVGIVQGIAALPGISRSGATISAALTRRFSREWAAEFSFFLSIPVIAGGAFLEILKIVRDARADAGSPGVVELFQNDPNLQIYFIGALISFGVGLFALHSLMALLKAGKLHYFAYWLFAIGAVCIVWTACVHRDYFMDVWNTSETIQNLLEQLGITPEAPTP